jgi:hypothetical protein
MRRPQPQGGPLELAGPVEQQEEGQGEHDDRFDKVVEQPDRDGLGGARGVGEVGRQLRRLLREQRGDVVLVVELAELLVVLGPGFEVLDVGGQLRAELLDLADDRRDHVQDQEAEADQEEHVGDHDRQPARQRAAADAGTANQIDQGTEGERQEDRREQPADSGAHLNHNVLEQQRHPDRHEHDRDHLDHGTGIDAGRGHGCCRGSSPRRQSLPLTALVR